MFQTLVFASVLLAAAPAFAQSADWDGAFPPAALENTLPRKLSKVLVVRATPDDETTGAATALINGLKASGATVLDDSSLGDVSALGDSAIAGKAKALGADSAAIVRIYPGPSGKPMAAVSVVDASGAPLVSFSVEKGNTLGGGAVAATPPAGAPAQPAQPPGPPPGAVPPQPPPYPGVAAGPGPGPGYGYPVPPPPRLSPAEGQYQAQFLGFGTYTRFGPYGPEWFAGAFQGVAHVPISMPSFFQQVGRPDLAEKYIHNENTRSGLMIGGTVITLGALIASGAIAVSVPSVDTCTFAFNPQDCFDTRTNRSNIALAVGLGGSVLGLVVAGVGYGINPMPVSGAEAQQMAAGYNANLRKKLGLDKGAEREEQSEPMQLSVAPMVNAHGGGLALRLDF